MRQHYFTKFFFKALEGHDFRVGRHHRLIDDTLDKVIAGRMPRLLVNEPPGFSKTLQCVHMLVTRGFALNPRARFLHVSYSRELVMQNSAVIRDIMALPEYQIMWGLQLRLDTNAKGLWRTPEGGSFKASSAGGAVTGFRAGTMDVVAEEIGPEDDDDDLGPILGEDDISPFSGALIIDDALKPDDASSEIRRTFVNERYMNTFRSRLAHERVPIIVDMQRIDPFDFSNHLLTGGGGEKFHHLMLPVEIKADAGGYPTEYTYGIPIPHNLTPGPLWPAKYNEDQINVLRKDGKVFSAQYMQNPRGSNIGAFKASSFRHYEVRPRTLNIAILCDPSSGKRTAAGRKKSDRTAMAVIGIDSSGNRYLLDGVCHRMNLGQRWDALKMLWKKWNAAIGVSMLTVGYEEYGLQADREYFTERQEQDGPRFPIEELNWPRQGSGSKEDRIQRLEPEFNDARFWLPATIYRAEEGGDCFWDGMDHGVVLRPKDKYHLGLTSTQKRIADSGEAYRLAATLKRRDENGQMYDLTWMLMQELLNFMNSEYDDLSDAVSRIFDLDIIPAPKREVDMVSGINASIVE